ncbi:MAG: hypothetical protein AAGB22_08755, partial [Bacteroidota bacterium]
MNQPFLSNGYALLTSVLFVLLMAACSSEPAATNNTSVDTAGLNEDEPEMVISTSTIHYQVPSPNELFTVIKNGDISFNPELIQPTEGTYTGMKAQALNMGRLTADIAYASSLGDFQQSIGTFDRMHKLSNELGISFIFDEGMVNRVKNNMQDIDSLTIISNWAYLTITEKLEYNEKEEVLALMAAGGYVESLHIILGSINGYNAENYLVKSIADQRLTLENLVGFLEKYQDNTNIASTLTDLQGLVETFAPYICSSSALMSR